MTGVMVAGNAARLDSSGIRAGASQIFPGTADRVAAVRRFVRNEIADHPARDDAVRVVSELAANAIVHTRSGDNGIFLVDLAELDSEHVAILVTDQGTPTVPPGKKSGLDGESGRGLMVVIALASLILVLSDRSMRTVAAVIPASAEHNQGDSEMAESIDRTLRTIHAELEGREVRESTLTAARQFLADTVESITPETAAAELLACAARSRAHLAAVVADSGAEFVQAEPTT